MKIFLEVFCMSQELRIQFCKVAKEWKDLKVVYEHRGTTRKGCDCTGLIIGILQELGYMRNYKLRKYAPDWNLHAGADNHIVDEIEKVADKIETPDIGDVVLLKFGRCVAHVGVVIEQGLFVHCFVDSKKCTVSSLWNSRWTKRIHAFYRFDGNKLNG